MDTLITLIITCPFCGKEHTVEVLEESYLLYQGGALAQRAFPYLTATQREQIISGLCPECQREVFGE